MWTKIFFGVLLGITVTAFDSNSCSTEWELVKLENSESVHHNEAIKAKKQSCVGYPIKTLSEGVFTVSVFKNGNPGCLAVDIVDYSDGLILSEAQYSNKDGWGTVSLPVRQPIDGYILLQSLCEENDIVLVDAIKFTSEYDDKYDIVISGPYLNPQKNTSLSNRIKEGSEYNILNEDTQEDEISEEETGNQTSTTLDPSSESTTLDPNSESTTLDSNTESTTLDPSSESTTLDPNTESTTLDPSSESITLDPSIDESTTESITNTDDTGFWTLTNIIIFVVVFVALAVLCSVSFYYIGKGRGRRRKSTIIDDDMEIPVPKVIPRAHNAYMAPQFERMREQY